MASAQSGEPPVVHSQSVLIGWAVLIAGLAAAIGWVAFGQKLGETIAITDVGAAMTVYYLLLFLPLIALAMLLGVVSHRNVVRVGDHPLRWLGLGVALGLAGLGLTLALSWLNGTLGWGQGAQVAAGALLLGSSLTLIQVAAEEVLFRGWLQPALVERIGPVAGVLVGAVLFAGFHLTAGAMGPLALANITLGGVWFGLLALRSGGIVAPLAAHFAWNLVEDMALGLTPNPGAGPLGSLIDLDLTGGAWWGAQPDGLNASIGTTAVLLALILPLVRPRAK